MLEAYGRIVRLENDGTAWIETRRQSACGQCAAKGACGTGALSSLFATRSRIRLPVPETAAEGDEVVLGMPENALLLQSLWAYGAPLVGFFVGALLAQSVGAAEGGMLIAALGGMAAGWGAAARFGRATAPHVVRIVRQAGTCPDGES